ncbi:MAG: hypothetical protein ILO68_04585 [Clostridia bacterium]|nr:hypothetical protein [Clostridia bacterium]
MEFIQFFARMTAGSFLPAVFCAAIQDVLPTVLLIVGLVRFLVVLPALVIHLIIGYLVYTHILKRGVNEDWGRHCSIDEPRHVQMYEEGMAWHERMLPYCKDVRIQRNGLNLVGEYYDFGSDCCVIFLPGRMESLHYSYYFVQAYEPLGVNILCIDPRAHGLSDGEYNTVGFEESEDILSWVRFLTEQCGVKKVLLQGVCIGAAGGLLACTNDRCPDAVVGLIGDGLFTNFGESMKEHLIERNKPVFTLWFIDFWMKRLTGHSMRKGPADFMPRLDKPLLLIHSRADKYSIPKRTEAMFETCPSENKKLVWFDGSEHSMIRYDHTADFDREVLSFARQVFGLQPKD